MILNENFLREKYREFRTDSSREYNQILNENARISEQNKRFDLFISHSFSDKEVVYGLMKIFNSANYSVYVDWVYDSQLDRNNVNASTAKLLRRRMQGCGGLAYVATSNITHSRWCPWELGYMDGRKNGLCAILPIMVSNDFKGQEYLQLYPYITYDKSDRTKKYEFWVHDPNDPKYYTTLRNWLNGGSLIIH